MGARDFLTRIYTPKDFKPTLAGVFEVLSQVKVPLREITIVSHGGGEGTMHFAVDAKDVAESHVQRPKATDEDDPDLYAKSGYDPKLGF